MVRSLKNSVVHFVRKPLSTIILAQKRPRDDIALRYRIFQASCTFVATKLRFVLTKVTCRMLGHWSGWPLFRMAKDGPGKLTTNVSKYEESENQIHQGKNDTGGSTTV